MNFQSATTSATVTETEAFNLAGYCDIWIIGLTSGSVELKILFPDETEFRSYPDASYSSPIAKSIFISEKGVFGKLVGNSCNDGTYLRLSSHYNK